MFWYKLSVARSQAWEQYVNIKWQVASNQIAASQPESPIMPDTQMRPDEVTDGLITPRHRSSDDHTNKTNIGNEEENHLQINPRLQAVWGVRCEVIGGLGTSHRDRKWKYYTLCSAKRLSHHNYLRTRNFCHSIPIRITSKTTFKVQNKYRLVMITIAYLKTLTISLFSAQSCS